MQALVLILGLGTDRVETGRTVGNSGVISSY